MATVEELEMQVLELTEKNEELKAMNQFIVGMVTERDELRRTYGSANHWRLQYKEYFEAVCAQAGIEPETWLADYRAQQEAATEE